MAMRGSDPMAEWTASMIDPNWDRSHGWPRVPRPDQFDGRAWILNMALQAKASGDQRPIEEVCRGIEGYIWPEARPPYSAPVIDVEAHLNRLLMETPPTKELVMLMNALVRDAHAQGWHQGRGIDP